MIGPHRIALCLTVALLSSLGLAAPLAAQVDTPQAIEEIVDIPTVEDVVTSSSGSVAWVEQSGGTWSVHVREDGDTLDLTSSPQGEGVPVALQAFSPDGKKLAIIRGEAPNRAGEIQNPAQLPDPVERTLGIVDVDTGRETPIRHQSGSIRLAVFAPDGALNFVTGGTVWRAQPECGEPATRLFTVRGTITHLSWSPSGKHLAFVTDRARYDRGKYAFVGTFDPETRDVAYMAPGLGQDQDVVWSPDGTQLAFIRFGYEPRTWRFSNHREGAPFEVIVADAATGQGGAVWTAPIGYGSRFNGFGASGYSGMGGDGSLFWTADNQLVFPWERTGWKVLYGVPASGGEARLLTPGEFEIDGANASPAGDRIVYWSSTEDDPAALVLNEIAASNGWQPRRIAHPGLGRRVEFAPDGLYFRQATETVPERLVHMDGEGGLTPLSSPPDLSDPLFEVPVRVENVRFRSLDGMEIPAIVRRPAATVRDGTRPALVYIHGGSRRKAYGEWLPQFPAPAIIHYFVRAGYVVVSVNYRSGIGYGLDFREPESYGGRGAGDVQDAIAAAQFLAETYPEIDAGRIGIYGHSYGGHLVSNALARSDVFAAGAQTAGVGDWVVEMERDFGEVLQFNIAQRVELERQAYESSAISRIDQWGDEPLLFLHGDDDRSAAMQQSLELYLAMRRRGLPAEALVIPEESHEPKMRRNKIAYLRTIAEFFARRMPEDDAGAQ